MIHKKSADGVSLQKSSNDKPSLNENQSGHYLLVMISMNVISFDISPTGSFK